MRVKLKGSNKKQGDVSMTLEHWQKEYSIDHKYLLYDFYDVGKIVDLYEIEPKTGKEVFVKCVFEKRAKELLNKGHEYIVKEHDKSRLNEHLMPVNTNQIDSFFKRILARIKQIIKPKSNPTKIPFSRYESITIKIGLITMIIAIVIPIILFIIDKIYFS